MPEHIICHIGHISHIAGNFRIAILFLTIKSSVHFGHPDLPHLSFNRDRI